MSVNIDKVFGPHTMHLSRFGRLTKLFLLFRPYIVHESDQGIVVYKIWRGTMYVFGIVRKPTQCEKSLES